MAFLVYIYIYICRRVWAIYIDKVFNFELCIYIYRLFQGVIDSSFCFSRPVSGSETSHTRIPQSLQKAPSAQSPLYITLHVLDPLYMYVAL